MIVLQIHLRLPEHRRARFGYDVVLSDSAGRAFATTSEALEDSR